MRKNDNSTSNICRNIGRGAECGAGTMASAEPAATESPVAVAGPAAAAATELSYRAVQEDNSVVATVAEGGFAVDEDTKTVTLHDAAGAVRDSVPLSYVLDGRRHPIAVAISDDRRQVRLTPQLVAADGSVTAARPVASPLENQLAMNDLINSVSFGLSAGSLIGTIVGAVIGVGAGLAVSGASCVVLSVGCVLAVVPIVTLLGGVGGLAGLMLGGAPGLVAGLWNYYTTLQAAPGASKYADQLPAFQDRAPEAEAVR
ncbi:hypothetical protein [Nocardia cyriacigeorgica]|nr:hypothetical protein [Nocardia cyriacigeorgica]